jgi:hypothetical protein
VISNVLQLHLVGLLKDYDVPGFRTQNVWTKEAWTNIVSPLNDKFDTSYSLSQVKQEQELKKYYHVVKELKEESLFVWDNKRDGNNADKCHIRYPSLLFFHLCNASCSFQSFCTA